MQTAHAPCPAAELYVPGEQTLQTDEDEALIAVAYVPAGQREQKAKFAPVPG